MRAVHSVAVMVVVAGVAGCGSADESEPIASSTDTMTFTTGEFEIPPGDSFTCFYTDTFTDREMSVVTASGLQGEGGHHILVFWTENPRDATYHECNDAEMSDWHQIAGSAGQDGAAEGVIGLPEGLAIKIPAGKQLVLQAHYINSTGAAMKVNDTVTLNLTDPSKVESYANYFVTLDEDFEAPPLSKYEHTAYCTIERDLDTVLSLGHMHEYGKSYKLEVIDEAGETLDVIRDDEWKPEFTSHPPVTYYDKNDPFKLTKGMRLKQTCSWDNTTTDPLLFPHEMCLAFFYYYPDDGELICNMTADPSP